jgi:hypothetical protein
MMLIPILSVRGTFRAMVTAPPPQQIGAMAPFLP